MSVVLEGMADGGVFVGIPRAMAQRIAAHTMMVNRLSVAYYFCFKWITFVSQSAASLVLQKGIHPAEVSQQLYTLERVYAMYIERCGCTKAALGCHYILAAVHFSGGGWG